MDPWSSRGPTTVNRRKPPEKPPEKPSGNTLYPVKQYVYKAYQPKGNSGITGIKKPKEYHHVEFYKQYDPEVDALTRLQRNAKQKTEQQPKPVTATGYFPKEIGSPVKSISRTLKLLDSFDRQVVTTGDRLGELRRQIDYLKHLQSLDRQRQPQ